MKRRRTKTTELKFLTTEFRAVFKKGMKEMNAKFERYILTGAWPT